jgi:hypothetical protein
LEYHGKQHYEDIKFFRKKGKEYLKKRLLDDRTKSKICKKKGIVLIEVPYTVKFEEMMEYIIKKAKNKKIFVPEITKKMDHKLWDIYSPEKIKEMRIFAESKGGKCLSDKYINNSTKLSWQCSMGHIWGAQPSSILFGGWCPVCARERRRGIKKFSLNDLQNVAINKGGILISKQIDSMKKRYKWRCKKGHEWNTTPCSVVYQNTWCPICANKRTAKKLLKYTIEDMKKFAKGKEGYCLSDEFINSNAKLKWKCKEEHNWQQKWSYIKNGVWCPVCAEKLLISHAKKVAKNRNGKCLSSKYKNSKSRLKWQCNKGHVWEASIDSVKRGSWCPSCARNKKLTIVDMDKIAKKRGGKCLSDKYVNARTKLKWICKKGHIWEAVPDSIRRGSWCRKCSSNQKLS